MGAGGEEQTGVKAMEIHTCKEMLVLTETYTHSTESLQNHSKFCRK